MMFLVSAFIGLLMVTMGRQLYWLFVAGIGFTLGIILATEYYNASSDWVMVFIALLAGLAGGLFAYALEKIAVVVAGLITGAYLTYTMLQILGFQINMIFWIFVVVGGLIGTLLVLWSFDWGLIILSSLAGATLIVASVSYGSTISAILFISLTLLGLIIQTVRWRQEPQRFR